jgi:flavin-dependent dehydrogenase
MEFDNLLFEWVKSDTKTTVFENTELQSVTIETDKVLLKTSTGNFSTDIIVGCDGAHSLLAKKLAGFTVNKYHYAGAVRAYHSNITGSTPNLNEIFFSEKAYPGYFWLFPLPDNSFNIGFGMLSKAIAEKK